MAKVLHLDLAAERQATVSELLADLEQAAELVFWQLRQRGVVPEDILHPSTRVAYAAWLDARAD